MAVAVVAAAVFVAIFVDPTVEAQELAEEEELGVAESLQLPAA